MHFIFLHFFLKIKIQNNMLYQKVLFKSIRDLNVKMYIGLTQNTKYKQ